MSCRCFSYGAYFWTEDDYVPAIDFFDIELARLHRRAFGAAHGSTASDDEAEDSPPFAPRRKQKSGIGALAAVLQGYPHDESLPPLPEHSEGGLYLTAATLEAIYDGEEKGGRESGPSGVEDEMGTRPRGQKNVDLTSLEQRAYSNLEAAPIETVAEDGELDPSHPRRLIRTLTHDCLDRFPEVHNWFNAHQVAAGVLLSTLGIPIR